MAILAFELPSRRVLWCAVMHFLAAPGDVGYRPLGKDVYVIYRRGVMQCWLLQSSITCIACCLAFFPHSSLSNSSGPSFWAVGENSQGFLSCIIFDLCIYYRETNIVGIALRRRRCNAFVCLLRQTFHFVSIWSTMLPIVDSGVTTHLPPMLFAKTFFLSFLSVHYCLLCWVCHRPCSVVELE